jgi:type IX secretion system substrate protein
MIILISIFKKIRSLMMKMILILLLFLYSFELQAQTTKLDHPVWGEAIQVLPYGGSIQDIDIDTSGNIFVFATGSFKYDVKEKTWSKYDANGRFGGYTFFRNGLVIFYKFYDADGKTVSEYYYSYDLDNESKLFETKNDKLSGFFMDGSKNILYKSSDYINRTTNMGKTWVRLYPDIEYLEQTTASIEYLDVKENYYYITILYRNEKSKRTYKSYYSPNKGVTWKELTDYTDNDTYPIWTISPSTTIVSKSSTNNLDYFYTTDTCKTWTELGMPDYYEPNSYLACNDTNFIYTSVYPSRITHRSTDFGKTWTPILNKYGRLFLDFHDNVYVLNDDSLYKSTDHGNNWEKIVLHYQSHQALDFEMDKFGRLYVAYTGGVLRTELYSDKIDTVFQNGIGTVYFTKKDDNLLISSDFIYFSDDYGSSWSQIKETTSGIEFVNAGGLFREMKNGDLYSYALLKNNSEIIIKSIDGGKSWQSTGWVCPGVNSFGQNSIGEYIYVDRGSAMYMFDEDLQDWKIWIELDPHSLGENQLFCHHSEPYVFASTFNQLYRSVDNGHTMGNINLIRQLFVDGTEQTSEYKQTRFSQYGNDLYSSYWRAGFSFDEDLHYIFKSTDFGLTWNNITKNYGKLYRPNSIPKIFNDGHLYVSNGIFGILRSKDKITSVEDKLNVINDGISIYPNPSANGIFNIQLNESFLNNMVEITVTNLFGQVLLSKNYHIGHETSIKLELDYLSNGNYFAIIKYENKILAKRLIIL